MAFCHVDLSVCYFLLFNEFFHVASKFGHDDICLSMAFDSAAKICYTAYRSLSVFFHSWIVYNFVAFCFLGVHSDGEVCRKDIYIRLSDLVPNLVRVSGLS